MKQAITLKRRIRARPALAVCLGSTANEIEEAIAGYEQTDVPSGPDIPPHYQAEASSAKVLALDKLREMLAARVEWEGEQVRLALERAAECELREEGEWAAEERAELDRQRVEHARIERELAEERARINADLAREEAGSARQEEQEETAVEVRFQDGVLMEVDPVPVAFQAEAEPVASDAVVLRSLAHVLERGGEPYAWIPSRLRTIADRLEAEPQPENVMRVRFEKRGGHYHCRVFTARQPGQTFAKNGDLVFDEAEWPDIPLLMPGAEFVEEVSEWP